MPLHTTPSTLGAAADAIVVRRLVHGDVAAAQEIQKVFALARQQEAAQIGARPTDGSVRQEVRAITRSADLHLGARIGGELVGVLTVGPDAEAGQLSLTALVVHPQHQRRGVGAALVHDALGRGAGLDFAVVAGAANAPALALYRSLGFVEYRRGELGPARLPVVKLRRRAP
jgi:ribosomal protein S18 acetylase RimI-like enzyme